MMSISRVDELTADIERQLTDGDSCDHVHAMDVLTHALVFAPAEEAMEVWRVALHHHELRPGSRLALRSLIAYLLDEYEKGNSNVATAICDCLNFITATADRVSSHKQ